MNLVIFGAQGYALGAYKALKTLCPKRVISYFVVSAIGNNAPTLEDIPVVELAALSARMTDEEKKNMDVLIATPENVQPEIEEILENYGYRFHRRLDSERWAELMKMFHIKLGSFMPLSVLPVGYNRPFVRIYMAKSHKDRPLKNSALLSDYVFPLQVGVDNCDVRIADLLDNKGENISHKNGNYSELTGLYWIWKNKLCCKGTDNGDEGQYYGLVQYRRMFDFSEDDLLRLVDNDVDVVLPYPLPYEPNIHTHHERYLKEEDWSALLTALRELQPEYSDVFTEILEQQYFYNYNVILAKKAVLREYCEWLFPILKRVEELSVPKGSERADRYIGYMGETLETLYFMKKMKSLNIVHTECRLII